MRIVDFSTRRPVTVFIFAVAAGVFGWVAFRDLAVDLLPDITYPSLTVQADFEGAAPVEVETLVTKPIEDAVGVADGVVRVLSSSRADRSEVTLEFGWGTDMDFAALDVREKLDVVRLPLDVERPVLLRYDPSLDPILRIGLTGIDDLIRLRLIAEEDVKRRLERIEGVAAVLVSGGLEEEIQVEIDERRLTGLGLRIDQITTRLAEENVNLTGGRLRDGQTEYLVRTVNELLRPEELREIVVSRQAGAIIRLEDVARVYKGAREREIITRIDGRESVEVAIYKEGGTNTVTVAQAVLDELEPLREDLQKIDPTLEPTVVTDQSQYIRGSVDSVLQTAILGGTLAIIILFLFLRSAKNTFIIGVSIPVSVMATFFLMYLFGVSLNIMSLGGLTLGIGLLLDNSIVVLESVQRKREEGLGVLEAARQGASEVGQAVVASTLTTVCVFAPIVFVEGIAGQLFGDQALTVTFSLLVSLGVALTLIPMLASREMTWRTQEPPEIAPEQRRSFAPARWLSEALFGLVLGLSRAGKWVVMSVVGLLGLLLNPLLAGFDWLLKAISRRYDGLLGRVLKVPFLTVVVVLVLLLLSLQLASSLGTELVPELIQGEFSIHSELPPGSRLEVTSRRLGQLEAAARQIEGVRTVYAMAGGSSEQGGAAGETRENIGQLTVTLDPPVDRLREDSTMERLRSEIDRLNEPFRRTTPGTGGQSEDREDVLLARFSRPSYFSFRTPIEIQIRGYNLESLERTAALVTSRLSEIPGLVDVKSSTEGGNPELQIVFDRERLATLGTSVSEVGGVIRSKVQGDIATDITREDRNIEIRLRADERYRDSIDDLKNLNVRRGDLVAPLPLSSIADVIETEGPAEIRRTDGSRAAVITANLVGRDLGSVSEDIESTLQSLTFPAGFDWTIGGQRQEMQTSFDSMRMAILLAVFMVYLVMASQFESLLHPFVILFSVPFSVIGVLAALWATSTAVSIVVLIGAILLAGIVVNNAIILVDTTNRLRRDGATKIEALVRAGGLRLRPILMTTATTILGLLPMAIGLGEGSELRSPMAITVIGGLLTSTFLTLLVLPAVYALLDRRR